MTLRVNGEIRAWRKLTADEYASLFPAKPPSLRKIARALKILGADEKPFTMNEHELAKAAGISVRSLVRWVPVFEEWGILEVKRWRYRKFGTTPNTYRTFLGAVIPENWQEREGPYAISARKAACAQCDVDHT